MRCPHSRAPGGLAAAALAVVERAAAREAEMEARAEGARRAEGTVWAPREAAEA